MPNDAVRNELIELAFAVCDGAATDAQIDRVESLIATDPASRLLYLQCVDLHCEMGRRATSLDRMTGEEEAGVSIQRLGSNPKALIPNPSYIPPIVIDPSPAIHSTLGSFVFSHIAAALILGIGLLVGLAWRISLPSSEGPSPDHNIAQVVGRITALVDCEWQKTGIGDRGPGSGISEIQIPKSPNPQIPVFLGDRFQLASGLMQITYETGAKVILQGPCTYEIDSNLGGYLAMGKLTALVEKGPGVRGPGSGNANHTPLSPLPSPLFSVRTPTAVVTDLGTEFGVEVEESGSTHSHVFQGSISIVSAPNGRRVASEGENSRRLTNSAASMEILHAGESARVERGRNNKVAITRGPGQPEKYVRQISKSARSKISQSSNPCYRIVDLGTLGGKRSGAWNLSANGQVVGWAEDSTGRPRAFLYAQGKMNDLGLPPDKLSDAYGVNSRGEVVGWSGVSDKLHGRAFLFSDGAIRDLGTLGGSTSCANAINDAGQIVGISENSDGVPHAFLYTNRSGMSDLGDFFGAKVESCAHGINEAGVVTGQSRTASGALRAFLFSSAAKQDAMHQTPEVGTAGFRVNELGQMVGSYDPVRPVRRLAYLYSPDTGMVILGRQRGLLGESGDINNHGQVVGCVSHDNVTAHAFLWQDGEMADLNTMIDSAAGWHLTYATGINDAGQIISYAVAPDGSDRAVLLTPIKREESKN